MRKDLLILSSVGLLVSSCSSEENEPTYQDPSSAIQVTTEVTLPCSRAGYTTETMREFGLIIASDNDKYTYLNKRMTGGAIEGWSTDETMYWNGKDLTHTVIAYAPYREAELDHMSKIDVKVSTDQSTAEAVTASDFIAMKNGSYVPSKDLDNGKLLVKLDHMLSKVLIKLTYPEAYVTEDGSNPVAEMTVDGMKVDATLDFASWDGSDNTVSVALNGNSATEAITPFELSHDATNRQVTYEFIAVPQEQANIVVKFTAGGTPYTWTYNNLVLTSGEAVTINLSVDKQGVQMGDNINVGEWNVGEEINGGQPAEDAQTYTIKELNDKANWTNVYSSPRCRWMTEYERQGDNVAFNGLTDDNPNAWFSHWCVKQNDDNQPLFGEGYNDIYFVLDLGQARWLSGFSAVTAGYTDSTFGTVEFFVTAQENIPADFTDEEKNIMFNTFTASEEPAENEDYRSSMRAVMDKAKALDSQIEWVKLGEVKSESNTPMVRYDGDIAEADLDKVVKSCYLKVKLSPLSYHDYPSQVGNRVSLAEIYLRYVAKYKGVEVK